MALFKQIALEIEEKKLTDKVFDTINYFIANYSLLIKARHQKYYYRNYTREEKIILILKPAMLHYFHYKNLSVTNQFSDCIRKMVVSYLEDTSLNALITVIVLQK